jgi:hypothetical protein
MNALMRSRTPQELIAAQSDLLRDNLEGILKSRRRVAEPSVGVADETTRRLTKITKKQGRGGSASARAGDTVREQHPPTAAMNEASARAASGHAAAPLSSDMKARRLIEERLVRRRARGRKTVPGASQPEMS